MYFFFSPDASGQIMSETRQKINSWKKRDQNWLLENMRKKKNRKKNQNYNQLADGWQSGWVVMAEVVTDV